MCRRNLIVIPSPDQNQIKQITYYYDHIAHVDTITKAEALTFIFLTRRYVRYEKIKRQIG